MSAETDLLPSSVAAFTEALNGGRGSLDAWLEVNDEREVVAHVKAYARANVAVATAMLQAEIEALRAEMEEWKCVASAQAELHDEAEECADRLAKALAGLITWIPSADTYRRLGFDPEAPMRALEEARAVLREEGKQLREEGRQ